MSLKNHVVGIDPGKDGGIAALRADGSLGLRTIPRHSAKEVDIPGLAAALREACEGADMVVMEDVHSIYGSSAGSNFQFGWINGVIEALVTVAWGNPPVKIQPRIWQSLAWVGVPLQRVPALDGKRRPRTKQDGTPVMKTDTKATSLAAANRLFPDERFLAGPRCKVAHDGLVDAALLAHFARVAITGGGPAAPGSRRAHRR